MMTGIKISKIKSIIKKWQRFTKIGKSQCHFTCASDPLKEQLWDNIACNCDDPHHCRDEIPKGYQTVYVGKSRRRYVLSSHYVNHPLFRTLVEKSEGCCNGSDKEIACEVVLFEHLLWMLANADPLISQTDSLEELVEFYAC